VRIKRVTPLGDSGGVPVRAIVCHLQIREAIFLTLALAGMIADKSPD
jgi:hypothetical protein